MKNQIMHSSAVLDFPAPKFPLHPGISADTQSLEKPLQSRFSDTQLLWIALGFNFAVWVLVFVVGHYTIGWP